MPAHAYVTILTGDGWQGPELEVVSVPAAYAEGFQANDVVGYLGLTADSDTQFQNINEVRSSLETHFASFQTALAARIGELFDTEVVVVEESPARTVAMGAATGAGVILTGTGVFGPWAILAIPLGVFLLSAAPESGEGFGSFVGAWFRRKARALDRD